MTSTVDGLISGLSTSQLISQLMQVEALPQTALKNKVKSEQGVVTAYRAVNSKLVALQSAAESLTKSPAWQAAVAASTSDAVAATASVGAPAGQSTFDVTKLARAQVTTLSAGADGTATTGGGLDISIGGAAATHINVSTNTLAGAASAINAANIGVRASVVTTDSGDVLQLSGSKTGVANSFTVTGASGTPQNVFEAADAKITFGDPAHGGYTASSSSNTFNNIVPGVTFTATREQAGVTISVKSDSAKVADSVQAMVSAANAALSEIDKQTAYDPTNKVASALTGDFGIRQLQQRILSGVSNGKTDFGSFEKVGISLDRSGQLSFDRDKFLNAFQADPAGTQAAIGTGVAKTMQEIGKGATDPTKGTITLAIQNRNSGIKTLNDSIANWDVRLEARQAALQRQYANLEVALGKLKDQSSWLSGQIASLPTNG